MKQFKHVVATFLLGLALVMAVMAGFLGLAVEPTRADGPDEAHIIIQFANDDAIVRKISFTAPISGYEALRLTGLDLITKTSSFGVAICAIEGQGDPASSCFSSGFWSSYYWDGAVWQTYLVGASDSVIQDGAVELWSWQPGFVSLNLPAPQPFTTTAKALDWLKTQQNSTNGSYGSDMNGSVEVLLALEANKLKGSEWGSPSLFSYIFGDSVTFSKKHAGAAGKLAVGLAAEGSCWLREAKTPLDYYDAGTGRFSAGSLFHSWAILGTRALSQTVPAKAVEYLQSLQKANGGWAWATSEGPDTNSTAVAIQALLAAGESVGSTAVVSGLNYLDTAQNDDGGFPYDPNSSFGTTSDTNSTAYVVQALLAAGEVLTSTRWITGTGATPISYLLNRQLPDGSFEWQAGLGSNQSATQQAIPALLGQPFPLRQVELKICPSTFLPLIVKN